MIRISSPSVRCLNKGFTLIELLVTTAIGGMLILGLSSIMGLITHTLSASSYNNQLARDAQFAMDQMVRAVAGSQHLILPLADNPNTDWPENIRDQTVPATPPIGASTLATVVLAVTISSNIDLNMDGVPDADNDADGRFNEDFGGDASNDGMPGLVGIDDNGDGTADVSTAPNPSKDNDEDNNSGEDSLDFIDNDGDGSIDEDMKADANNDGQSGVVGIDDDFDFSVDESSAADDDEDGQTDEDWLEAVVFYLSNGILMQRTSVPWDESGDGVVDGLDFVISPIAENVTQFRVERINSATDVVNILIALTHPVTSETLQLQTSVRIGGSL